MARAVHPEHGSCEAPNIRDKAKTCWGEGWEPRTGPEMVIGVSSADIIPKSTKIHPHPFPHLSIPTARPQQQCLLHGYPTG